MKIKKETYHFDHEQKIDIYYKVCKCCTVTSLTTKNINLLKILLPARKEEIE